MVGAICASLQAGSARQSAAGLRMAPLPAAVQRSALVRAAANPFAGTYCGYLGGLFGSITISGRGSVSGSFSYWSLYYRESLSFSGRVTAAGAMSLKVTRSITVLDRGRGTWTERFSATLTVALDDGGSLVGTSGWKAPFALSPCQ